MGLALQALGRLSYEGGVEDTRREVIPKSGRVDAVRIVQLLPQVRFRLLEERPDAIGLAVPGMPYGSPGMGPESEREAYDVFLIRGDGSTEVFTSYAAA